RHHSRVWQRGNPPVLLRWDDSGPERGFNGPAVLSPAGRFATRADDLFGGWGSWTEISIRREAGNRAGAVSAFAIHHCLGCEYPRQQCSPVAVHRGSAPEWGEAGGD